MIMQVTDCTCGISAVSTRSPLSSVWRWKTLTSRAPVSCGLDLPGPAARWSCLAGRVACSCGQFLTPLVGNLDRLALAVVVADEDAFGLGHDPAADAQL